MGVKVLNLKKTSLLFKDVFLLNIAWTGHNWEMRKPNNTRDACQKKKEEKNSKKISA